MAQRSEVVIRRDSRRSLASDVQPSERRSRRPRHGSAAPGAHRSGMRASSSVVLSWDALTAPDAIARDAARLVLTPRAHLGGWAIALTFAALLAALQLGSCPSPRCRR